MESVNTQKDIRYHSNKEGDLFIVFSNNFLAQHEIKRGDLYNIKASENKINLIPIIRMSRLKREMKKYQRRLKSSNKTFQVYLSEKHIGYINKKGYKSL